MEEVLKIRTIEDFERILIERPEWKERIRRLILTEELLNLPAEFNRFVKEDFKPLKEKVENIEKDVEVLKKDVEVLKQDVEVLKQDVAILKEEVAILKKDVAELKVIAAELKDDMLELKVRDRLGAFLGKLFAKLKLIDHSDLADRLYEAAEEGKITEEELNEALEIDAVAEGFTRKPEKKKVCLAIEISYVIDKKDAERALRRAEIISRACEIECIPVAIGKKVTKGARDFSEKFPVLVI